MHCSAGHSLCITFPISPHNPWRHDLTRFPSAAPLSASLGEDSIPATAAGSARSYRCRARAFALDHLSERISPLVLWSELARSELSFTERVNAHIIVYSVRVTPTHASRWPLPQLHSDLSWYTSDKKQLEIPVHVLGENHSAVNQNEHS